MISRLLALPLVLGLLGSFVACGDDEGGSVGAPCNVDSDCASGLICDEHEGQASCQEPHGHDEGEGTAHETEHAETEHATGHDSDTGHHDTGATGHEHDSETSHEHDSGETGQVTGTGTGTGTETGTGG